MGGRLLLEVAELDPPTLEGDPVGGGNVPAMR
jgi:hypothetical protein